MRVYCPNCGMPLEAEPEMYDVKWMSYGIHVDWLTTAVEHKCEETK